MIAPLKVTLYQEGWLRAQPFRLIVGASRA